MKEKKQTTFIAFIILVMILLILLHPLAQAETNIQPVSKTDFLLNTVVTISIYDTRSDTDLILEETINKCKEYEGLFSKTMVGSDIYKINHSNGEKVLVNEETVNLLNQAINFSKKSGGVIDLTINKAVELWTFDQDMHDLPTKECLDQAITHIDYRNVQIDGTYVCLKDNEASIDLGFIAKGYIADRLKDFLVSKNIEHAIINLGGNVLTIGGKTNTNPFHIQIQSPTNLSTQLELSAYVRDSSVVTSGTYERYCICDGKQYHHILDPTTGYPVDTDLISVTIFSKDSTTGDALSTTCLSLGLEKGMDLIHSLPNIDALFITNDGTVYDTRTQ